MGIKFISFLLLVCTLTVSGKQNTKAKVSATMGEPVSDLDGNVYRTVIIGSQHWMAENLKVTRYLNGDNVKTTHPANLNISDDDTDNILQSRDLSVSPFVSEDQADKDAPAYCWFYNGDETNSVYGLLYTWYAANDPRGLCPEGWRIPTDKEWSELIDYLGGDVVAGGMLKQTGTEYWAEPNVGATNESGFNALPAGGRYEDGSFSNMGKFGAWWTSSTGVYRHIEHDDPYTFRNYYYSSKYYGFSVRCIKK